MIARTMPPPGEISTQPRHRFMQADAVSLRDADRRRAALSLALTFRLAGRNGKQAAKILGKDDSTFSRYTNGNNDTPFTRLREDVRRMCANGVYPVPVLVDLVSELWSAAVKDWSLEELIERKRQLHRDEQKAQARVDAWQMDDLEGVTGEAENEVDEALLEQATRTVELYMLRQEIRLRTRK